MSKIIVDIWRTSLHREEIGIKKSEEYRAKSRKFTADMDLFGKVKIDKSDYGYIGYRKKLWETDKLENKILDVRLFDDTMNWLGTIEENLLKSVLLTIVNEETSLAFAVTLRDTRIMFPIESVRARFLSGNLFSLPYISDNGEIQGLILKSKKLSIGGDWEIIDALTNKKIAKVDGKVLDIGGRWEIDADKIKDENLRRILILFAATLRFYDDLKERTEKLVEKIKKEKKWFKLNKAMMSLFYNPKVRR